MGPDAVIVVSIEGRFALCDDEAQGKLVGGQLRVAVLSEAEKST